MDMFVRTLGKVGLVRTLGKVELVRTRGRITSFIPSSASTLSAVLLNLCV